MLLLSFFAANANAQTVNVNGTQRWNSGNDLTYKGKDIIVEKNSTFIIDIASASCKSIKLGEPLGNGNYAVELRINAGNTLTVDGNVDEVMTQVTSSNRTATISFTNSGTSVGKLVCAGISGDEMALVSGTHGVIEVTGTNTLPSVITAFNNLIISGTTTLSHNITLNNLTINGTGKLIPGAGNTITSSSGAISGSGTAVVTRTTGNNHYLSQYAFSSYPTNSLTVEFAGAAAQNTSFPTFYNLKLSNTNGLTLNGNTSVSNSLILSAGNVSLGTSHLKIEANGTITGASSTSHVVADGTGRLKATVKKGTSFIFPVGYNPYVPVTVTLPGSATDTEFGVNVSSGVQNTSGPLTQHAVGITWNVMPSSTVSGVLFSLGWNTGQNLTNFNTTQSFMMIGGGGFWSAVDPSTMPSGTNISSSSNSINDFNLSSITGQSLAQNGAYNLAVGDVSANLTTVPLPVELISFTATKQSNEMAMLNFATAWEINNAGFEVERSTNGISWNNIGFVAGNGNSTEINNYAFPTSLANISAPVVYYRLKQVDFNGQFEYSATRTLRLSATAAAATSVYPNPATSRISVNLDGIAAGEMAKISVMDMSGKILISANQVVEEGNFTMDMNIDNLTKGNYIVNIASPSANYNTKLVKF
ncbi:MAG: T9SS type A sorting domain-containing protein [Bacteroidia bacterium]